MRLANDFRIFLLCFFNCLAFERFDLEERDKDLQSPESIVKQNRTQTMTSVQVNTVQSRILERMNGTWLQHRLCLWRVEMLWTWFQTNFGCSHKLWRDQQHNDRKMAERCGVWPATGETELTDRQAEQMSGQVKTIDGVRMIKAATILARRARVRVKWAEGRMTREKIWRKKKFPATRAPSLTHSLTCTRLCVTKIVRANVLFRLQINARGCCGGNGGRRKVARNQRMKTMRFSNFKWDRIFRSAPETVCVWWDQIVVVVVEVVTVKWLVGEGRGWDIKSFRQSNEGYSLTHTQPLLKTNGVSVRWKANDDAKRLRLSAAATTTGRCNNHHQTNEHQ